MSFEHIILEKKDGLAWIKFNRPDVFNAMSKDVYTEIDRALVRRRGWCQAPSTPFARDGSGTVPARDGVCAGWCQAPSALEGYLPVCL